MVFLRRACVRFYKFILLFFIYKDHNKASTTFPLWVHLLLQYFLMSQMIVKMECRKLLGLNFILCVKNAIKTIIQLNIFSCMSCKKPKRNERRVDSRSMNLSLFLFFLLLKILPAGVISSHWKYWVCSWVETEQAHYNNIISNSLPRSLWRSGFLSPSIVSFDDFLIIFYKSTLRSLTSMFYGHFSVLCWIFQALNACQCSQRKVLQKTPF